MFFYRHMERHHCRGFFKTSGPQEGFGFINNGMDKAVVHNVKVPLIVEDVIGEIPPRYLWIRRVIVRSILWFFLPPV